MAAIVMRDVMAEPHDVRAVASSISAQATEKLEETLEIPVRTACYDRQSF
jgi:hypothetical protein